MSPLSAQVHVQRAETPRGAAALPLHRHRHAATAGATPGESGDEGPSRLGGARHDEHEVARSVQAGSTERHHPVVGAGPQQLHLLPELRLRSIEAAGK